jgi:peptidoglycan/LPS O-acetylase OafA/YrhL
VPDSGSSRTLRLDSLTGLRFFAALAVVLVHVGGQFATARWLLTVESYGYAGVSFFFVLSGFVLTWSHREQSAGRFWWRRFARSGRLRRCRRPLLVRSGERFTGAHRSY